MTPATRSKIYGRISSHVLNGKLTLLRIEDALADFGSDYLNGRILKRIDVEVTDDMTMRC
jgi:hypothetical protein